MAKTGFVMSMVVTLLGIAFLSLGQLVQAFMPALGRMAFAIGGGSYDPSLYDAGSTFYWQQAVAMTFIVAGTICSLRCYSRGMADDRRL